MISSLRDSLLYKGANINFLYCIVLYCIVL